MKTTLKSLIAAGIASVALTAAASANPFAQDPGQLEVDNFLQAEELVAQSLRDELAASKAGVVITNTAPGANVLFSVDPDAHSQANIFSRSDFQGQNLVFSGGGVSKPISDVIKFHQDPDALNY